MNTSLDRFSRPLPREFSPAVEREWVLEVRTAGIWVDVARFDDEREANKASYELEDEFVGPLRVTEREVDPVVIGWE